MKMRNSATALGIASLLITLSTGARADPPPPEALPHETTGPDPGYAKELQNFCNIEGISGANRVKDPRRRAELINNYLLSEPMSPRFHRFFYDRLGTADEAQKVTVLREEMKANGIVSCTFADNAEKAAQKHRAK